MDDVDGAVIVVAMVDSLNSLWSHPIQSTSLFPFPFDLLADTIEKIYWCKKVYWSISNGIPTLRRSYELRIIVHHMQQQESNRLMREE